MAGVEREGDEGAPGRAPRLALLGEPSASERDRDGEVGLSVSAKADLEIDEDALLAEIPESINEIMAQDMELALDWRLKTRELFGDYFERGYAVRGFHRSKDGAFYRLEREETPAD